MKEEDVKIGMKVKLNRTGDACIVINGSVYRTMANEYTVKNIKTGKKITVNAYDFEPYIDIPDTADALNRAFNNLTETLTNTLQPLIDALSRPEVAKALEALGKDECPDTLEGADRAMWYNNKTEREQEKQREAVVKAYKEFRVSGTPYSSFTIFEAGYRAGMKRGDKRRNTRKHSRA